MTKIITRFAPSPTGNLHMGNARIAILNWLFAQKYQGDFLLRLDDTDKSRCKEEFTKSIETDLQWLKIDWKYKFHQKDRIDKYIEAQKKLGDRLYPCYETPEELDIKRKILKSAGKACVYDRQIFSESQIEKYIDEGRSPHFRFLLNSKHMSWNDMIRGEVSYDLSNISDPVLIRNNKSFTYMLCSTVDDEDHNVSHIIRGEDHIVNTAVQKQLIEALNYKIPTWGHASLIFDKNGKLSKRNTYKSASYLNEIKDLICPETILSFLSTTGRSKNTKLFTDIKDLIDDFDINHFSKSNTIYDFDQIVHMNKKFIQLQDSTYFNINAELWNLIKMNIAKINEIDFWNKTLMSKNNFIEKQRLDIDESVVHTAIDSIPYEFSLESANQWFIEIQKKHLEYKVNQIKKSIRIILTSVTNGPEIHNLLHFLGYDEVMSRLKNYA